MDLVLKIITVAMALAGALYLFAGYKEKHKGIITGGLVWLLGAFLTYQFNSFWPLPIAFVMALFLNKNPEHGFDVSDPRDTGSDFHLNLGRQEFTIPSRIASEKLRKSPVSIDDYCRQSRTHDGYKREAALKELVKHDLGPEASAYVLVALSDYVIEISSLPLKATPETKNELCKIVAENPKLVTRLEAVAVSYWNAYYREKYGNYADYPAYAFLQTLKAI